MTIITSNCWNCGMNIVIAQNELPDGYRHGVIPMWIMDLKTKQYINNSEKKRALCTNCMMFMKEV
jgi:hypothetical protein